VGWLAREGVVSVGPGGEPVVALDPIRPERAAAAAAAAAKARRRLDRSRVEMVRSYAEARDCRRRVILGYFGEGNGGPCGNCDNCEQRGQDVSHTTDRSRYPAGERVRHQSLGEGTVMRTDGDTLVILFDDQGYTTLSIPLVEEGNLLHSVTVGRR
jgi:ATP-dependent DNA helicase RecQ